MFKHFYIPFERQNDGELSFEFIFNFTRLSLRIWTYVCPTNTLEGNRRCQQFNYIF